MTMGRQAVITYDPKKKCNVVCGFIEDGAYVRTVIPSVHLMRIMGNSYGIQEVIFEQLIGKVERIIIKEPTCTLSSTVYEWMDLAVQDRGHGRQRFMPRDRMTIIDEKPRKKKSSGNKRSV